MQEFTGIMPGPTITTHTFCELAQSKCAWTLNKNTSCENLQVKCRGTNRGPHLARASACNRNALGHVTKTTLPKSCRFTGEMRNAADQNHFVREFVGKMPGAKTADHTLCEPAQSKCTWTLHKSHFEREFTGKMPRAKTTTHTLCEPARSKCTRTLHKSHFLQKITGDQLEHRDQAPAFTLTVRTPQCGHTVWGMLEDKGVTYDRGAV